MGVTDEALWAETSKSSTESMYEYVHCSPIIITELS